MDDQLANSNLSEEPGLSDRLSGAFDVLCELFPEMSKYRHDFTYDAENKTVVIVWPAKDSWTEYDIDSFYRFMEEAKTLTVQPETGTVTSNHSFFQLIAIDVAELEYLEDDLAVSMDDGTRLSFCASHFLVACAAIKAHAYHRYFPPTDNPAIEIHRVDGIQSLTAEHINQLIDAFLFEVSDAHNLILHRGTFLKYDPDGYSPETDPDPISGRDLRPLEPFNPGIKLYLAAAQVADPELQLLSYYKVFEYFAPLVLAIEATDTLRKKLDSPRAKSVDADFLRSIFDLTRSFEMRKNERELIKILFAECLDLVELSLLLPTELKQQITYDIKKVDLEKYSRTIAECLVSTRNWVAHAHADHERTGTECSPEAIPQFNIFLKSAAAHIIRWYNRLPEHLKTLT